ncbi:MAG: hypothetical protein GY696_17535 [Gammaproteobacteria bacterium]|nr:hypothetical protein [Gammaproteobacteria bacterium]
MGGQGRDDLPSAAWHLGGVLGVGDALAAGQLVESGQPVGLRVVVPADSQTDGELEPFLASFAVVHAELPLVVVGWELLVAVAAVGLVPADGRPVVVGCIVALLVVVEWVPPVATIVVGVEPAG